MQNKRECLCEGVLSECFDLVATLERVCSAVCVSRTAVRNICSKQKKLEYVRAVGVEKAWNPEQVRAAGPAIMTRHGLEMQPCTPAQKASHV